MFIRKSLSRIRVFLSIFTLALLTLIPNVTYAENTSQTNLLADKPLVGICILVSSNFMSDKENESYLTLETAIKDKFPTSNFTISKVNCSNFKNFLGKRDILVSDMQRLMAFLKLPTFTSFGMENNLDYVMIIICDAKTKLAKAHRNTLLYNNIALQSRVTLVDVRRNQYVYNFLINKARDQVYLSDIRAIRDVAKEWAIDFDNEFNTTKLFVSRP